MQIHDKNKYQVLGMMSGSSLDGVDLAFCTFTKNENAWHYQLIKAETIPYEEECSGRLISSSGLPGKELVSIHFEFGRYLGNIAKIFLAKHDLNPDVIASHGHTVFHEPENGYTFQLGDGQAIARQTGHVVVCDFRSKDMSLGGQGAPLVPIGDELLFGNYPYCLNIGGIANISYNEAGKRIAYDVCPANQMINYLSKQLGKPYDDKGKIASSGKINDELLIMLNKDPFYHLNAPKSLSNQYVTENFIRLIDDFNECIENKLRTVTEHIAIQLAHVLNQKSGDKVLISGGGAYNHFLIERLKSFVSNQIILPDDHLINFKEAIIFAFLGVLKMRSEVNCLASVTGAITDSSGGVVYYP